MTLQEIFKDELHLLENDSVKKLIEHTTDHNARLIKYVDRLSKFENDVMDTVMYSELILINGTPAKEALDKIAKLYEAQ